MVCVKPQVNAEEHDVASFTTSFRVKNASYWDPRTVAHLGIDTGFQVYDTFPEVSLDSQVLMAIFWIPLRSF